MDQIRFDKPVEEASRLLRIIRDRDRTAPTSVNLFTFYAGMKQALSETDFRGVGDASDLPPESRADIRRERRKQFGQYRELFLLELKLARCQRRKAMAVGEDWSDLSAYLRDGLTGFGPRLALRWAGISFWLGIPGAMDWCDAAATCMMRSVLTPNLDQL